MLYCREYEFTIDFSVLTSFYGDLASPFWRPTRDRYSRICTRDTHSSADKR